MAAFDALSKDHAEVYASVIPPNLSDVEKSEAVLELSYDVCLISPVPYGLVDDEMSSRPDHFSLHTYTLAK